MTNNLLLRAKALKLHGIVEHWDEVATTPWINDLITWEETTRSQRSLERRLKGAHIGCFKLMANFDWSWPTSCDRELIEEVLELNFIKEITNVIFSGSSGVGKTMIARNIAHQAVITGYSVLFTTAGQMLSDLTTQDGDIALRRRIKFYVQPTLLCVDEVGYLSYSNRHADLLFEIISRRYETKPTLITTNKPFTEWKDMFPNVSCVVSLIDRLVHKAEIIRIEAPSYRLKESEERRLAQLQKRKPKSNSQNKESKL
jgi:DNA replication protein DnaC